jgi:hypothetical protein
MRREYGAWVTGSGSRGRLLTLLSCVQLFLSSCQGPKDTCPSVVDLDSCQQRW